VLAGNRFSGLLEQANALEAAADPGKQFDESLQIAVDTQTPLVAVEDHYAEIWQEKQWRGQPPGRAYLNVMAPGLNPIDLGEQIGRMESVDWARRIPVLGGVAGTIHATELAAAAERLKKDNYAGAVARESKSLGQLAAGIEGYEPPLLGPEPTAVRSLVRDRDVMMLTEYLLKQGEVQERGQTFGAKVFDGLSYMPAWMIEFALTGGLAKLGSETAKQIGVRTLRGYAQTTAGQAVLKAAGWSGGVITRTTLGMPQRIGEEIAERRIPAIEVGPEGELAIGTPQESWATSISKGYLEMLIQVGSESAGEAMVAGAKAVTGAAARKVLPKLPFGQRLYDGMRQAYLRLHPEPGAAATFVDKFFDAAKFDGLVAEIGENHLQTILEGIAATRNFTDQPDPGYLENLAAGISRDMEIGNLAVEATIMAVPTVARAGGTRIARVLESSRARKRIQAFAQGQLDELSAVQTPTAEQVTEREFLKANVNDAAAVAEFYTAREAQHGAAVVGEGPAVVSPVAAPAAEVENQPSTLKPQTSKKGAPYVQGQEKGRTQGQVEASIWEQALAEAEQEASAQATERYRGPEQLTEWDYQVFLETLPEDRLGRMARRLGVQIPGAKGGALKKWVADAISTLTKAGPEPPLPLPGERHPGSMSYSRFFDRYGKALADDRDPQNRAWLDRYVPKEVATAGPRGIYEALQEDYHRGRAWELFRELTDQPRAEAAESNIKHQTSKMEEAGPTVDETYPRTQEESHEANAELAAADTMHAVNEFFGIVPPPDLPAATAADGMPGPEPTPRQYSLIARLLDRLGIREREGYEPFTNKDFREIYKFLQLPDDIRRTFPQFDPVYQVQRARERAKQVLDRVLADRAKPYFDLSDAERKAVDAFLVANDLHPGDNAILGPMQAELAKNPRQWAAYKAARTTLDYCKDLLVERMRALGVDEARIGEFLGRIENYIPHTWEGKWAAVVKDANGRTLYMAAGTKGQMFDTRRRLGEQYPGSRVDIIERTKMPYEMFQDAPAWALNAMIQQITEEAESAARKKGVPVDKAAIDAISQAFTDLYKAKGFGLHFIQRAETPGWSQDLREPLAGYLTGFSGFMTKMEAGMKFTEALSAVDPRRTPQLYKYATEYIRYVMGDEAHWTRLRPLLYWYYMNANLKTATVNLSGSLMMGWPVLSKYTRWSGVKLMEAMARTAAGRLTDAETAFLADLEAEGYLDPKLANEISASGGNAINRLLTTPMGKVASWLDWNRMVEGFNRRAMAVALYDAGITDTSEAARIIDEAHFHYGKGNRPTMARGPVGIIATFRSYTLNQIAWIKNQVKSGQLGALSRHLLAWTLIGGLGALPLAGWLKRRYAEAFASDIEEDAADLLGDIPARIAFRGLPSAAGVNLQGSVSMQDIAPEPGDNWYETVGAWVLGVTGDIPDRAGRVSRDLAVGDYRRALEDASPEALRNPLAAWRLHHEGATTRSGRKIWDFDAGQQLRLSEKEMVLKALGFQSDKLANEYDRKQIWELVSAGKQELKGQWADRLYLALQQNDQDAKQDLFEEIAAYNAKWQRRNRPDLVISPGDLLRALKSREKPVNWPTRDEAAIWRHIWGEE